MRNLSETHRTPRRGRIFPHLNYTLKEVNRKEEELEELMQRCNAIFERVKPELIDDYYDWFIVIEPNSGDYFIDKDENIAQQKADEQHPNAPGVIFCINETGTCDKV
jgi:hypothetical protein